jgi:hypothetical protein
MTRFHDMLHGREAISGMYRATARAPLFVSVVLTEDTALSIHTPYLVFAACCSTCCFVGGQFEGWLTSSYLVSF